MPNSGMLDHLGFRATSGRRSTYIHWMDAWPTKVGYQTPRTFKISDFSRHMIKQSKKEDILRIVFQPPELRTPLQSGHLLSMTLQGRSKAEVRLPDGNSIAPFHTFMKPTCGYFFDRGVDNRRKRIGVPAANIVAWRSVRAPYSRALAAA